MIKYDTPRGHEIGESAIRVLQEHGEPMTSKQIYELVDTCEHRQDLSAVLRGMIAAGVLSYGPERLPGEPGGMDPEKGGRAVPTYRLTLTKAKASIPIKDNLNHAMTTLTETTELLPSDAVVPVETDAVPGEDDPLLSQLSAFASPPSVLNTQDTERLRSLAATPAIQRVPDWALYLFGLADRIEASL